MPRVPPQSRLLRTQFEAEPFKRAMELIGRRWTLQIFAALADGPLRRTHLRIRVGSVSDKVLTDILRDLERSNLIMRTYHPGTPPRVDYGLTGDGQLLTRRLATLATTMLREGTAWH